MTDLQELERNARRRAHGAPIYTGPEVLNATRSSMRACALSDEWLRLRQDLKRSGLEPLPLEDTQ